MRILITGTTYHPGLNGQAIFTTNLAEGLARRGHEVLVVYPSEKGKPFRGERNGVQLEAVNSISLEQWHEDGYFTPFPTRDVRRVFKAFQPEVVHIQDHYMLSRSFALIARRKGVKTVGTNHFMPENLAAYAPQFIARNKMLYNWLSWRWVLEVYNRLDVVVAQSAASAKLVRDEGLHPSVVPISCGIDLSRFRPDPSVDQAELRRKFGLDPTRIIFLFVGRVDREKRVDVLLHAIGLLNRADIQLVVAGQGAALDDLRQMALQLNLGKQVHFAGFIASEDLPGLLNSVDVFTMPSEAELLSIASLEAMACARPLLLADAVALPELVTQGINGLLFRPGDPLDAARCIDQLASSREKWPAMGQASLERARAHSLDSVIEKYEDIYRQLLDGRDGIIPAG